MNRPMSDLPPSLVPAGVDLRDFHFMPLDVQRLLTSDTWTLGSGDERSSAMTLWLVSWHQVPAGSLPSNDRQLALLSHAGNAWRRVKAHALRGWIACADDRLYHPVVAEKVLEAWLEKLAQRISSGLGNLKRWKVPFDPAPFEAQMQVARALLQKLNPHSRALTKKRTTVTASTSPETPDPNPDPTPTGNPDRSPDPNPDPVPMLSQETGKGQGQGIKKEIPPIAPPAGGKPAKKRARSEDKPLPADFQVFEEMAAWAHGKGLSDAQIDDETEKFTSHHKAKATRFSDWDAAWRTWILKAIGFGLPVKPPPPGGAAGELLTLVKTGMGGS